MADFKYIFNCPVHGEETTGYCFRAFDKENRKRWKKVEVTYTPVEFNEYELDGFLFFLNTPNELGNTTGGNKE